MRKKLAMGIIIIIFAIVSGCTTAGPFVTNISSDGNGNLIIEKSYVKMNAFMGTVSNVGGSTATIKILDKK